MKKLRVLIVEDTAVYRRVLSRAVEITGSAVVACTAANGLIALDCMKKDEIDVVLMDVFMSEMNGIEALKIIKKDYPATYVIMISTGSSNNAKMTLEALEAGAMDFILKPTVPGSENNAKIIANRLQLLFAQIKVKKQSMQTEGSLQESIKKKHLRVNEDTKAKGKEDDDKINIVGTPVPSHIDLILIASSTGGPAALESVCSGLDKSLNCPVLIVQHMPPRFTKMMAESLGRKCELKISEGKENDPIEKGNIVIAPGGLHMCVKMVNGSAVLKMEDTPNVNGVKPSADVLFSSVAREYKGKNILAVVLTGMGSDGKIGVNELKNTCNCYCITQSEETCVIYGMPRSVYEAGLSDEVSDIGSIATRINEIISGSI